MRKARSPCGKAKHECWAGEHRWRQSWAKHGSTHLSGARMAKATAKACPLPAIASLSRSAYISGFPTRMLPWYSEPRQRIAHSTRGSLSMPKLSDELLDRSLAATLAAIEVYNKPNFSYREEVFAILAINGWELLLKARLLFESENRTVTARVRTGLGCCGQGVAPMRGALVPAPPSGLVGDYSNVALQLASTGNCRSAIVCAPWQGPHRHHSKSVNVRCTRSSVDIHLIS